MGRAEPGQIVVRGAPLTDRVEVGNMYPADPAVSVDRLRIIEDGHVEHALSLGAVRTLASLQELPTLRRSHLATESNLLRSRMHEVVQQRSA